MDVWTDGRMGKRDGLVDRRMDDRMKDEQIGEGIEGWTHNQTDGQLDMISSLFVLCNCFVFSALALIYGRETLIYRNRLACVHSIQAGVSLFSHSEVSVEDFPCRQWKDGCR